MTEIMKTYMISEKEEVCSNCKYFMQHYVYDKRFCKDFTPCNAGHCIKPRVKDRKPSHKACEHFERRL